MTFTALHTCRYGKMCNEAARSLFMMVKVCVMWRKEGDETTKSPQSHQTVVLA